MNCLLIVAVLVAVTSAQVPKPCVSPPQWEARSIRVEHRRRHEVFAKISYDSVNLRVRRKEHVMHHHSEDGRHAYDELFLHKEKKGYRLNLKTRECRVFDLVEPFHIAQVPYNATSAGEAYIGTSALQREGVLVTLWSGESTNGDHYFGAVTYPDCIPVSFGVRSERFGVQHNTLFDVTLGISNPNVFIPPPECMK